MNNTRYTIALSLVFGLIAVVTCLLVLVALMIVTGQRLGPLQALPAPATIRPVIIATSAAVVPTTRLEPIVVRGELTSTPVFLSTPAVPLVRPTAMALLVTVTPTPRPLRPRQSPTTSGPTPTLTLPGNVQYVLDGQVIPDVNKPCMGASIYGRFRDGDGNPVAGIRVKVWNEYLSDFSAPSKPVDATDAGYYDFIINPKPSKWTVVVVDGANNPISPAVDVIRAEGSTACYFEVNWKRVQ